MDGIGWHLTQSVLAPVFKNKRDGFRQTLAALLNGSSLPIARLLDRTIGSWL